MTRTIIIRDDDTSAFTPPALLERTYGKLWEREIPVTLAVIPAPRGDVRVLHRAGRPVDPGIPPQYRGKPDRHPLTDNPALCKFLNEKVKAGLVEVALHGYDHSYYEYELTPLDELRQRMTDGLALLRAALPDAEIKSFIAPYDRLSPEAVELVLETGLSLCTMTNALAATPYRDLQPYHQRMLENGQHLYACDEYLFNRHDGAERGLALAEQRLASEELLIVVNHYWTFFYDWADEWKEMIAAWDQFTDQLLAQENVRFTTFSAG